MREYISLQDVRLAGPSGHIVRLRANEPKRIPASLETIATMNGCVPADQVQSKDEGPAVEADPDSKAEQRQQALVEACRAMCDTNERRLFTVHGFPRAPSVRARLAEEHQDFTYEELQQAWEQVDAAPRAE